MRRLLDRSPRLILLLAAPPRAAAAATRDEIIRDCADDGALQGDYSPAELRDARQNLPSDVAEYTDCGDVLRRAELRRRRAGKRRRRRHAGGGGGRGRPGGVAARRRRRRDADHATDAERAARSTTRATARERQPTSAASDIVPAPRGLARGRRAQRIPAHAARPRWSCSASAPLAARASPAVRRRVRRSPAAPAAPRRVARAGAPRAVARRAPTPRTARSASRCLLPRSRSTPRAASRSSRTPRPRSLLVARRRGCSRAARAGLHRRARRRRCTAAGTLAACSALAALHRALDRLVARPGRLVAGGQPDARLPRGVRRRRSRSCGSRPAAGRRCWTASRSPAWSSAARRC